MASLFSYAVGQFYKYIFYTNTAVALADLIVLRAVDHPL